VLNATHLFIYYEHRTQATHKKILNDKDTGEK